MKAPQAYTQGQSMLKEHNQHHQYMSRNWLLANPLQNINNYCNSKT